MKYEGADHLRLICQLGWLTVRNSIRLDLGIFMCESQSNLLRETIGEFYLLEEKIHSRRKGQLNQETFSCLDMI